MKFKRRHILLSGLTAGLGATIGTEQWQVQQQQRQQAELEAILKNEPRNVDTLLASAFESDSRKIYQGQQIQAAVKLTPPLVPYDREMSRRLILCSKIATQQYLRGKIDPTYDGSIRSLPAYRSELDEYQQIATFRGKEALVNETIALDVPTDAQANSDDPIEQEVNNAENTIQNTVRKAVRATLRVPVYIGFALISKKHSLIVFRGSQTRAEWVNNVTAFQEDYTNLPSKIDCGKIHSGFLDNYRSILEPLPRDVAAQLNPTVPCYVSGHSLGAALAVLASLDIALNVPAIKPQLQLYIYASPRVGDPTFAKLHNELIPNSYRVVNQADTINLLPPTNVLGVYLHIGQEWSFLAQNGDLLPNHVVDTYQTAINRAVETSEIPQYPISGTS
ncbi:lipase family protein [Leptolyngbya ohadii]|uniref:lipase family protein n=1 Tax=Leptolyngbya ohadii TaxID=1962290 RepID=UPI000B59E494|nr:lipase [Leptolyngbya ohadii]